MHNLLMYLQTTIFDWYFLATVKYPEQINYQNLAVINEYAALRGCIEILTIIARKLGNEYVNLAKIILEKKSISDSIDDEVVKFMKARIRGDEIPFTMDHDFMEQNVLEHNQDEVKSEPDSGSYFEDSENEDDIMYESDSDLDETNDENLNNSWFWTFNAKSAPDEKV